MIWLILLRHDYLLKTHRVSDLKIEYLFGVLWVIAGFSLQHNGLKLGQVENLLHNFGFADPCLCLLKFLSWLRCPASSNVGQYSDEVCEKLLCWSIAKHDVAWLLLVASRLLIIVYFVKNYQAFMHTVQ